MNAKHIKGRFAPSPSGRMHLGNVYAALMSWLSAKSKGGQWLLRIEDLDPGRSRREYARLIEEDLQWLGLEWDEGGLEARGCANKDTKIGSATSYLQSQRSEIYQKHYNILESKGLTYACHCSRADILATQAPHESDGRVVYHGTCRPAPGLPPFTPSPDAPGARRLFVPDEEIYFTDRTYGSQSVNLSHHCGDFIVRRSDGAWAYQLAVVVDDALMGVTEVVRGADLLLSTAQQIYLYRLFGYDVPVFAHLPLLCNSEGQRLSKRDNSLSMENLRANHASEELIGIIAAKARLIPSPTPLSLDTLTQIYVERTRQLETHKHTLHYQ